MLFWKLAAFRVQLPAHGNQNQAPPPSAQSAAQQCHSRAPIPYLTFSLGFDPDRWYVTCVRDDRATGLEMM